MEPFPLFCVGRKILREIFMGYKTIFLENSLDEIIDHRLKEKLKNIWK